MVFTINQDILTKLTIVAVIGIVVVGALIVLQVAGVFGDGDTPLEPGETPPVPTPPFETPPSQAEDEKTLMLNWTYRDRPFSYTTVITNATYDAFRLRDPGVTPDMTTGDAVARYVTTDGDAGTISSIADYILEQSVQNGWGDYDTIRNTAAFAKSRKR